MIKIGTGVRGWRYEHRVVMENKLGRELKRDEHVHHINQNTLDNRAGNLVVLAHGAHSRLTHKLTRWSKKHLACKECGTTTRHHEGHGLCTACFQRR